MKSKILIAALFTMISIGAFATDVEKADPNVRANTLIERVKEIRSTDKSEMTRGQKKEMREELREIKSELKELEKSEGLDDKVSISIGAVIIILLVILLI